MIGSALGLDVSSGKFNTLTYWRLLNLFGIGLVIGLVILIFINYIIQIAEGSRKYVPIDRIGLLSSYVGFVSLTWAETYIRYQEKEPLSFRVIFASLFMLIGIISLTRKVYRVSILTDEDKLVEDHQDF